HRAVENPGEQDGPDQLQHFPVTDPLPKTFENKISIEPVEEGFDVGVYHPRPACSHRLAHSLHGLMRAALGPEPIRARQEISLEDRLEHALSRLPARPPAAAGGDPRAGAAARAPTARHTNPAVPAAAGMTPPAAPPRSRPETARPQRLRYRRWGQRRHPEHPGWHAPPTTRAGGRPCGGPGQTARGTFGPTTAWPPGKACVAGPEAYHGS